MDVVNQNKAEAKKMRRRTAALSGSVGLFMLVSVGFSYAFGLLYQAIVTALAESEVILSMFISNFFGVSYVEGIVIVKDFLYSGIVDEILGMISMLVCLFVPAYIFGKMWGFSVSDCFEVKGKYVKGIFFVYAFCQLVMLCMTNIADGMWSFVFPSGPSIPTQTQGLYSDNIFVHIISFLCTCIMVPVVEEFVFRGAIFGIFRKAGTGFAVVASAVCFGLMHGSVLQCMYAVGFGIVSAMLVVVTGNIKTSVLFHALNNTVSFLSSFLPLYFGQTASDIFTCIYILFVMSFSFYGMYLFFAGDGILASFRQKAGFDSDAEESTKLSALFSLPFIVYIVYYALRFIPVAV